MPLYITAYLAPHIVTFPVLIHVFSCTCLSDDGSILAENLLEIIQYQEVCTAYKCR